MFQIVPADLTSDVHCDGIIKILDSYADEPLPLAVRENLAPRLEQHPTTEILLATNAEQVPVGAAICFLGFSTFAARPLLNLHDLAVLPDYRGCGIGQLLLAGVEERARELDCCKVTLEVRESNPRAKALYHVCGYQDFGGRTFFMEKTLTTTKTA